MLSFIVWIVIAATISGVFWIVFWAIAIRREEGARPPPSALMQRRAPDVHHMHIADQGKLFRWYLGMKMIPYAWRLKLYQRDQGALHQDYEDYLRSRRGN